MQLTVPLPTEALVPEPRVRDGLGDEAWAELRARVWRQPVNRRVVRERLLGLTATVRELLVRARPLEAEWEALGIEVRQAATTARGYCSPGQGDSRVVYVNERDPYEVQRFTVAHEVAHLLLANTGFRRPPLSPPEEERLCEQFAGRLLIDHEVLARRLPAGSPPAPDDLLRLCGHFRVNIRPMLIAVGEQLARTPYCLVLSRRRGHSRRPEELAFRVESVAGSRHVYFPPNQRLRSVGLTRLAEDAERAAHGDLLGGRDTFVTVGLRGLNGERSSRTAHRNVTWRAIRHGVRAPFLLAVLDLGANSGRSAA